MFSGARVVNRREYLARRRRAFAVPADALSALFNKLKVSSSNFVPRSCYAKYIFTLSAAGFVATLASVGIAVTHTHRAPSNKRPVGAGSL